MENNLQNTIVIDSSPLMYRTAVLEDGLLKEVIIDKKNNVSLVGNIYAAHVRNILPAQFAFVDIGEKKNAFLFLNDKKEGFKPKFKKNQLILVQVVKDPTGDKGAYVSTQLNFGGRLCVLVANDKNDDFTAVSKKITSATERERLRKIAANMNFENCSVIIRTTAEGVPEEQILAEAAELKAKYDEIRSTFLTVRPPAKLYYNEHPLGRVLIDLFNNQSAALFVNSWADHKELLSIANRHHLVSSKIHLYEDDKPIFEKFNIEKQLAKALEKKLWLKSGAFLYIERTEAMTVFDVNSGKFPGSVDNENSMFQVNLEAASEIARQLRLRNLSGIILIDFIDMKNESKKLELLDTLKQACAKDRISVNVVGITKLGLVELTRKKAREPISAILTEECDKCEGGRVLSSFFVAAELLDKLRLDSQKTGCQSFTVSSSKEVIIELQNLISDGYASEIGAKISTAEYAAEKENYKIKKNLN